MIAKKEFEKTYREYRANLNKASRLGAYEYFLARVNDEALVAGRVIHLWEVLQGSYLPGRS